MDLGRSQIKRKLLGLILEEYLWQEKNWSLGYIKLIHLQTQQHAASALSSKTEDFVQN